MDNNGNNRNDDNQTVGSKRLEIVSHRLHAVRLHGGVNVFVVVFILVAIARSLFKDLNIPWWMYSCSCLGSSTVTIGMLPGSPQIQNRIFGIN